MGKFNIPRIARPLDLAAYAPELAKEIAEAPPPIFMWINLSRDMRTEYFANQREAHRLNLAIQEIDEKLQKAETEKDKAAVKADSESLVPQLAAVGARIVTWWAEAWNQGPEAARWTAEEMQSLLAECFEKDPALWDFIVDECWRLVNQHREGARKN